MAYKDLLCFAHMGSNPIRGVYLTRGDKMKKTVLFLLFVVILATVVYAPGPEEAGQGNAEPQLISAGPNEEAGNGKPEEVPGEQKEVKVQAQLHIGLENALGNVENENARQRLQQNMEQFQNRYQERIQNMEQLEVKEMNEETGEMKLSAREEVRFLGFIKGKARKSFEIDAEGNITEKHPWYRFMYRE